MRFLIPAIYVVSAHRGSDNINSDVNDINLDPVSTRRFDHAKAAAVDIGHEALEGFTALMSSAEQDRVISAIIRSIKIAVDQWEQDSIRRDNPFPATKGEDIFKRRISDLLGEAEGLAPEVKERLEEETRAKIRQLKATAEREWYGEITGWLSSTDSRYIFMPNGMISWLRGFLEVQLGHEARTSCEWRLKRMSGPVTENHFVNQNFQICLHQGLETAAPEPFTDGKIHVTVNNRGGMEIECGNVGFFVAHKEDLRKSLQIQPWQNGRIGSRDRKLWGKIHNAYQYSQLTGEVFDRTRAQTLCARLARGRQIVSEILDSVGPRTQIEYIDERNIPNRDLVNEFLRL
jgi:hypothetical protein